MPPPDPARRRAADLRAPTRTSTDQDIGPRPGRPPPPACSPTTSAARSRQPSSSARSTGRSVLNPDGSFTYTPTAGYSGPDSFIYQATNGAGSAQATAAITVIPTPPVIPAPVAGDDSYSTDQDTALTAIAATGVLANDSGSALTASLVTGPQHGTLTLNANGSFTYTPTLGYSGPDAFHVSGAEHLRDLAGDSLDNGHPGTANHPRSRGGRR